MLLEFYGTECSHCRAMEPLVEKLEKELSVKVEKYECWHNEENDDLREKYDGGACGGVPFFYNTETKAGICGEASYEVLAAWAKGEAFPE